MGALYQSGTFTTIADLMTQLDTWIVTVAGYTRNMAPTVDNTFGTGPRAHYQFTRTSATTPGDTRQLFLNIKGLTAMLASGTYIPDGLTANLSDGYSAAVQWHVQPGYPVIRGSGLSANASLVSSRINALDVTPKAYDFYTDGIGNVVLSVATLADGTGSNWSTATYAYRQGLIFGFLDDIGCGTGYAATGGTAGTFIYGKNTSNCSASCNGLVGNQDLYLGCVNDNNSSNVMRPTFITRVKAAGYDGWASSVNNLNTGIVASRTTAMNKASSGYPGWVTDYFANCDISSTVTSSGLPGNLNADIDNSSVSGFFPIQWMSMNAQYNTITGKFFVYQPTWFVRDEATLRWFPVGRMPLVYQQRADTTNYLANPGSITVGGQAYDIRGPLWIKKITV